MSVTCKVCIVGEMAVGKTSLANRFISGKHCKTYKPSFYAQHYHSLNSDAKNCKGVFIWDTVGFERFRSMTPNYLRGTHCCMLTFSLTDKSSFHEVVEYWSPNVKEWAPDAKCILVANKVDAAEERVVTEAQIKDFCNTERIKYFETSAVTGFNVKKAFDYASDVAVKQYELNGLVDSFQVYTKDSFTIEKRTGCCS